MEKTYFKILYLFPAKDNTFVFLGKLNDKFDECVVHMDANGKVLFEYRFHKPMHAAAMMVDNEFIMVETSDKLHEGQQGEKTGPCITILELDSHTFRRTPYPFFDEKTDKTNIKCFADTKLLCIEELGRYEDNRFKLSYFKYPPGPNDKPMNQYVAKDEEWTYEWNVFQANHHSMMAWAKSRHDQEWHFRTYDLRDDPNGKLNTFLFKQEIGLEYGLEGVQVSIEKMWETTPNSFMFISISNKTKEHKNKELGVVQNIYICDTKTETVREARFGFGENHELQIHETFMGKHCFIKIYLFSKDGNALKSPIYYINNATETIVDIDYWEPSYIYKDEISSVDTSCAIHNQYENANCEWFICCPKKIVNPKEIALHFLLEMNENFDEDLLQDVVEMIDY